MEIIGDDKRIRALFSEARLADEQATPSFTSLLNRAQARALRPRPAFKLSFVAAVTATIICVLVSLAVWSQHSQPGATYSAFADVPAPKSRRVTEVKTADQVSTPIVKRVQRPFRSRITRSTAQSEPLSIASRGKATTGTKSIDTWQSPTAVLLTSPTDGLFKSLPQLNENANELKLFLPGRANEKEK